MSIRVEQIGNVGLITLDREKALNALNSDMIDKLIESATEFQRNPDVACIVLTGSERAFAAGADIKELAAKDYLTLTREDYFAQWEQFTKLRIPKIAAVSGYALGGGCELAMMCDTIYAAENARFGQPEINLALIPGMGGSQRLARLVGRVKAMDMVLTGRTMDAHEAEKIGLVARVFKTEEMLEKTLDIAQSIATLSETALVAARESIGRVDETSLQEGLLFERRVYHSLWNTPDQKEGLSAFIEKRPPVFGQG